MSIDSLMDWGATSSQTVNLVNPATLHLILYKGDTWVDTLVFEDDTDPYNPIPIDLTGYAFALTVKRNLFDNASVIILTLSSGLSTGGDNNNELYINAPDALQSGQYVYDLRAIKPSGQVITYCKGNLKIQENV